MAKCENCHRELTSNEIGLHKRMINRGAESFMCIDCLADYFKCDTELLRQKIVHFRNQGCTLFAEDD